MSSQDEEEIDVEGSGEPEVIEWEEKVEEHTLAVLEGDLEDEHGVEVDDFDGVEGVAQKNTERYITDFEEEFNFMFGKVELSVEREGGLNTLSYWSEDPQVMDDFRSFVEERVRDVEQQPYLEPYKFKEVRSDEVMELVRVFEDEFELSGPLPRGSNGQPRMHLPRVTDIDEGSEYKHESSEQGISGEQRFPGDAEYVIEGFDPDAGDYGFEIEGSLEIRPQKHENGKYVVEFISEDEESLAYMVNTSLRAVDPDKQNISDIVG